MQIRDNVVDAIGHTPLIKLERASAADRLHHSRQGRVHESRRLGEGPSRPADDLGGREARRSQARRPRGRGHRGQHRHWACRGRSGTRLPHADRHPQHPEPGKEGHAAALRRRARRGAGAALQQSEQLPARRAPPRRPAAQDREERRAVRRPVEQPRQPSRALSLDRPGNLRGDARQGRRLHLLGRHRRHARRRLDLSARKEEGHRHRLRRSARALRCTTCSPPARRRRPKAARSPRASGSAASRRSSTTSRWTRPISFPTRRPCR